VMTTVSLLPITCFVYSYCIYFYICNYSN
jgi:hypothetical protein